MDQIKRLSRPCVAIGFAALRRALTLRLRSVPTGIRPLSGSERTFDPVQLSTAIKLIQRGITANGPATWADLGAGSGIFTRALAQLLPKGSIIYAVDTNKSALEKIKSVDGIEIKKIIEDFIQTLSAVEGAVEKIERSRNLLLDGILMANSLHFVQDKTPFLKNAITHLKPKGSFIIVEYNMDTPNRWVPYPISFESTKKLFWPLGYQVQLIGEEKSVYNTNGMYAAYIFE